MHGRLFQVFALCCLYHRSVKFLVHRVIGPDITTYRYLSKNAEHILAHIPDDIDDVDYRNKFPRKHTAFCPMLM
jgi:hypothetical protein